MPFYNEMSSCQRYAIFTEHIPHHATLCRWHVKIMPQFFFRNVCHMAWTQHRLISTERSVSIKNRYAPSKQIIEAPFSESCYKISHVPYPITTKPKNINCSSNMSSPDNIRIYHNDLHARQFFDTLMHVKFF